jgi:TonB family protein
VISRYEVLEATASRLCRRWLVQRNLPAVLAGFAIWLQLPTLAAAQAPPVKEPAVAPEERIATESLVAPRLKTIDTSRYPISEVNNFGEGWVQLGFMVDSAGKPFEVTVEDSNGDKVFEEAAVKALEEATFEPGQLNGKTVESSSQLKIVFSLQGGQSGAFATFVSNYRSLMRAIKANNRAAGDSCA